MVCPLCERRAARRSCPALGHAICATCCGTKRQREIACPDDCIYLRTARSHPPAVARRQQQRDAEFLVALLEGLTESQYRLWIVLQGAARRYRVHAVPPLQDGDLADAAAALASTYETAGRGIIYEHATHSLPAQRLQGELRGVLQELTKELGGASSTLERDAGVALRRLERGARLAAGTLGQGSAAFLDFLERTLRPVARANAGPDAGEADPAPRIILP